MKPIPRSPLLSARIDWIVLEILILFIVTVVYTVIIWIDESGKPSQTGLETFKVTVKEVVPFFQLALIYIIGAFEIGGEIMLRFTHKIQQAIEQGVKQGIEQGIEQGRAEVYRVWYTEWEKRKQEAAEKGMPFNEPPPPNPNNATEKE
ncbi:MAG: hypothetical protein OXD54_16290 [Candidatus Poribacteria bacterium]|nr:hypothetical protein [Candidatus Poribacteria bacterium]